MHDTLQINAQPIEFARNEQLNNWVKLLSVEVMSLLRPNVLILLKNF